MGYRNDFKPSLRRWPRWALIAYVGLLFPAYILGGMIVCGIPEGFEAFRSEMNSAWKAEPLKESNNNNEQ